MQHSQLEVETEEAFYETEFRQVQIEITGKCNMNCQHCRASGQPNRDMPIEQIIKIMSFAHQYSSDRRELVISGGEPLMHKDFARILSAVRENGFDFISLTTNGTLLNDDHMRLIEDLAFRRFIVSVSLDDITPCKHDEFRAYEGAFSRAVEALSLVVEKNIPNTIASIRSSLQACQIVDMEDMVKFAQGVGCKRVSFASIHPAGRTIARKDLWMDTDQNRAFLEEVYRLKEHFPDLQITTNDPLQCLIASDNNVGEISPVENSEVIFNGCGAAAITFNVNADGNMTPCAMLDIPMMNIFPLSIEEITDTYRTHPLVRGILARNFKGECFNCSNKYKCGGCRARALVQNEDFFGADPLCWIKKHSLNK
jgi:MoaA/NifB/PqqE/SkfB family radical SAM enzyme